MAITLRDEEGDSVDICEECLKSGPNTGMRERVRQQVEALKKGVTSLEEIAEAPPIDAPTFDAYKQMVKEEEEKFFDSLSPEQQASIRGLDEQGTLVSADDIPF